MTISRTHIAYATLAATVIVAALNTRVLFTMLLDAATKIGLIR